MKTLISLSLALLLAAGGALALFNSFGAGAEASTTENTPVYSVLVTQSSCSTHLSTDGALMPLADTVNRTGGQLNVVLASSKPETLCSGVEIPAIDANDETRLRGRLEHASGPLAPLLQVGSAIPSYPEIDLVESIRAAVAPLNTQAALDSGRQRKLIIHNPGVDTANQMLSFLKGVLQSNYRAIIDEMAALDVLPNCTNIEVVWVGLGQTTAEPQQSVPYEYISMLKDLWGYFLEKCGVLSVSFQDATGTQDANTVEQGYPFVTPVPWPPSESGGWVMSDYISLTENVLGFYPEEATYRDVDGVPGNEVAQRVLAPYAEALRYSGQAVVICGSAWDIGDGDRLELSLLRAQRVRDDLIAMGVPAEQLIAIGCGNLGTGINIGGKVVDFYHPNLPPEASRAIHFVPTDNGMADEIIARFG